MAVRKRAIVLLLTGVGLVAGLVTSTGTSMAHSGANRFSTAPVRTFGAGSPAGHFNPFAVGPNKNITNRAGAQSETSIAVDPTNFKHQIASSNDLTSTQQVYESFDRGITWTLTNF